MNELYAVLGGGIVAVSIGWLVENVATDDQQALIGRSHGSTVEWRFGTGVALVGGIGLGTAFLHLLHVARTQVAVPVGVVGTVPLSLALLLCSGWLLLADLEERTLRVGLWCVAGVVLLVLTTIVSVLYQGAQGIVMRDLGYVLANHATVGGTVGFLIGLYDAHRVQTKRRLAVEHDTAEQRGRRLTVLNRVLRHDIRNDVNVIRGNAQLLYNDGADVERIAETITKKADRLHELGENARHVEWLLRSEGDDEREAVDVVPVVEAKAVSLRQEYGFATVETDLPERARILAHPLFDLAVEHLLENAVEHNDSDQPRVDVTVSRAEVAGEGIVTIRIADDGPGIPATEREVLERGSETSMEHTSGLGLWLVNWITTASGGDTAITDNSPRGSVVTLTFPSAPADHP